MKAAQLRARAIKHADALIAKPQNLAVVQWLPLAAVAATLLLPRVRQRAIAAISAAAFRELAKVLR